MPPLAGWTLWITGFAGKVPVLDQVMKLLVSDYFIPVTISLIMLALWTGHPDRVRREQLQRTVMKAAVAIGISTLFVKIIDIHFTPWPRPYLVEDLAIRESAMRAAQVIFYMPLDPTFPGNAATISFAAATGIWLGSRKAGTIIYILAFLWAFARLYAGVHFFVDILSGAVLGILTALFISKVFMPWIEPLPSLCLRLSRFLYIA